TRTVSAIRVAAADVTVPADESTARRPQRQGELAGRRQRQAEWIGRPKVVRVDDDGDAPRFRPGSAAVELETVVVTPKQVAAAMRSLPRTSAAAIGALMAGLTAAFAVCTGMLAGPGIGLAAVAIVAGMAGEAATDRRRVVGKGVARLGM